MRKVLEASLKLICSLELALIDSDNRGPQGIARGQTVPSLIDGMEFVKIDAFKRGFAPLSNLRLEGRGAASGTTITV
jgi:hypothetical protein